jgi:hypothetical protein
LLPHTWDVGYSLRLRATELVVLLGGHALLLRVSSLDHRIRSILRLLATDLAGLLRHTLLLGISSLHHTIRTILSLLHTWDVGYSLLLLGTELVVLERYTL